MFKAPIFLFPVAVGVFLFCTSCSPPTQRKEEAALQKKEELVGQVLQMSGKHNADVQWLTILDGREFYTIELQEALLEPRGRSRLLLAPVVDVLKREDNYFLTAHPWINNVYFQLQCNAEQTQYILSNSRNEFRMFGQYAIVMRPTSVHKPVAQLAGEIDGDYAYVVHDAADIVVVKGTCLDILSLEDSHLAGEDLLARLSEEKP